MTHKALEHWPRSVTLPGQFFYPPLGCGRFGQYKADSQCLPKEVKGWWELDGFAKKPHVYLTGVPHSRILKHTNHIILPRYGRHLLRSMLSARWRSQKTMAVYPAFVIRAKRNVLHTAPTLDTVKSRASVTKRAQRHITR